MLYHHRDRLSEVVVQIAIHTSTPPPLSEQKLVLELLTFTLATQDLVDSYAVRVLETSMKCSKCDNGMIIPFIYIEVSLIS